MRNSGIYQLVSKHSIPGDQRDPMRRKMETRVKRIEQRMDGMEAKLEEIKRRLRMLDPELVRRRTRRHHALSCRSGNRIESNMVSRNQNPFVKEDRDETEEKFEKIFSKSKSRESENSEQRRNDTARETAESEKEERIICSSGVPLSVIAKSEGSEGNNDDQEPPSLTSEDSTATATATDGGETLAEARFLSLAAEVSDREEGKKNVCSESNPEEEKQSRGGDNVTVTVTTPEEGNDGEATEEMVVSNCDLREGSLSLVAELGGDEETVEIVCDGDVIYSLWNETRDEKGVEEKMEKNVCDSEREEKKRKVECSAMKVNSVDTTLGQAQCLIITPPQLTNKRGVLQEKREMDQKENLTFLSTTDGSDKTMDPPNTLLMAENKAFNPGGSFFRFWHCSIIMLQVWDSGGRL